MRIKYFFIIIFIGITQLFSQHVAIVDMEAVLNKMPEYKSINLQLELATRTWEAEIRDGETKLKKMKEDYNKEEIFYTAYLKEKKQAEIQKLEQDVYGRSKKYFGYEGLLFKKKQELIKPIQDKIYNAIQRLAKERSYDLVLDKSAGSFVLYMDAKLDITYRVLQLLGY